MINKLRKTAPILLAAFVSFMALLSYAHPAFAATETGVDAGIIGNAIVTGIQAIVEMIVNVLGKLTIQLIHILIQVAGYNGFMSSPAVTTGWVIVRDIANLFFVALILVVSIGSIVKPDTFGGVKQVVKILGFALLVNFSRTIAALFIDISQLVMLTFVNGFAAAAGGNFVEALGITKLTDIQPGNSALTFPAAMGGLFLALLMFIIITVIIAVMVVALVVRMVMLWMLIVLSPIAFALGSYQGTHKHYAKWWEKFSKELTTGPIVAFFLWLSLVSFQGSSGSDITGQNLQENAASGKEAVSVSCGDTVACSEESMIRFIVATVMLLAGLGFAEEFGGLGGSLAKSAMSTGKKYANSAINFAAKRAALPVGVGLVGGVPAGIAAGAGYLALAKTNYGKQATNRLRGFAGRTLGGGNAVGNAVGWVPGIGSLGRGMTVAAGKKREEMMKDIRSKTTGLNESQRMMLFKSPVQPQILKDVIALDIVKDKKYSKAKADATDGAERKRYDDFVLAFKTLDAAGKAGDKDSGDKAKDVKEARPDIVAAASGKTTDLTDSARKGKLEDLKKIDFELMGKDNRNAFFAAMDPAQLDAFEEKGSTSQEKGFIREFRSQNALTGDVLRDAIAKGANVNAQPAKIYDPASKSANPNVDLAIATVELGNATQIRGLKGMSGSDKSDIRDAIVDGLRKRVDFGSGAGLTGAAGSPSMVANDLRHAEAAVILGADAADLYRIKDNGSFAGPASENSFTGSVGASSPQRLEFILSLKDAALRGQAGDKVYESISAADLDALARRAQIPEDRRALQNIVEEMHERAYGQYTGSPSSSAESAKAKAILDRIAANPDLNRLAPSP